MMWPLLAVTKAGRSAALFAAAHVLSIDMPIAVFLWSACTLAAASTFVLQPRWSRVTIKRHNLFRVVAHASGLVVTLWLWCYGLKYCGPVLTVLLDASEVGIVGAISLAFGQGSGDALSESARVTGRRSAIGLVMLLIAYAALLCERSSDVLGTGPSDGELEHSLHGHVGSIGARSFTVSTHARGEFALLLAAALTAIRKGASRKLTREVGGPMRLFLFSTAVGAGLLVVPALLSWFSTEPTKRTRFVSGGVCWRCASFVAVGLVANYRAQATASDARLS